MEGIWEFVSFYNYEQVFKKFTDISIFCQLVNMIDYSKLPAAPTAKIISGIVNMIRRISKENKGFPTTPFLLIREEKPPPYLPSHPSFSLPLLLSFHLLHPLTFPPIIALQLGHPITYLQHAIEDISRGGCYLRCNGRCLRAPSATAAASSSTQLHLNNLPVSQVISFVFNVSCEQHFIISLYLTLLLSLIQISMSLEIVHILSTIIPSHYWYNMLNDHTPADLVPVSLTLGVWSSCVVMWMQRVVAAVSCE